jgi:AAA+ ATPase superfamily predicted ATPase
MDRAIEYRSKCKHFRTLIIGRANAGKTTLLKKVCNSIEDPEIFSPSGEKVIESAAFKHKTVCSFESITINCSSIPPSCRSHQRFNSLSHSNSPSLSIAQRGIHDIENQLIFKSNPQFIFHDSRGFESGSLDEIETVKSFITERARSRELPEQLHAIWCGGYDST